VSSGRVDPLEGLEARPIETQVAVLANEVRNIRNSVTDVDADVVSMKRALYGLIFPILAGMIIFLLTFTVAGVNA